MRRTLQLLLLTSALPACAFFGKSDPMQPRYYDADSTTQASDEGAKGERAQGTGLRLGRVVGGAHLRERIAYRSSPRELGYYEERRWTERPETYVHRSLSRALFDERGIPHVVSGGAPILEVELTHFDELLAPRHAVRVTMRAVLVNLRTVRMERTFTVELPVKVHDDFDAVAEAMAKALGQCVSQVAQAVEQELATVEAPPLVTPPDTAAPAVR